MGVKGRLKDMSLVDIIQIFNAERKTSAIHLGSDLGYGRVFVKGGEIVHAVYRDITGVEAFYQLITWNDGEFEVEPGAEAPERTIHDKAESVIIEGLRRYDESRGKGSEGKDYVGDLESIKLIGRLIELNILEKA